MPFGGTIRIHCGDDTSLSVSRKLDYEAVLNEVRAALALSASTHLCLLESLAPKAILGASGFEERRSMTSSDSGLKELWLGSWASGRLALFVRDVATEQSPAKRAAPAESEAGGEEAKRIRLGQPAPSSDDEPPPQPSSEAPLGDPVPCAVVTSSVNMAPAHAKSDVVTEDAIAKAASANRGTLGEAAKAGTGKNDAPSPTASIAAAVTIADSPPSLMTSSVVTSTANTDRVIIKVTLPDLQHIYFSMKRGATFQILFSALAERPYEGKSDCCTRYHLLWDGDRIEPYQTPEQWGMDEEVCMDYWPEQVGRKPVILYYSPEERTVRTSLTLSPAWEFSAIYPVRPVRKSKTGSSSITWQARVGRDGVLTDEETGIKTSYHYWEATSGDDGRGAELLFDPHRPHLSPVNGIAIRKQDIVPYLERVLDSFGMTVLARTDMITFWLPDLNAIRQSHVALRFLSLDELESAASLRIEPKPDFLMRVFLLFKGVDAELDGRWRSGEVVDWRDIVGVDEQCSEMFRVVEWGGMVVR